MRAEPIPLHAGNRGDNRGMSIVTDENPRNRTLLIVTDNEISAKLLGDIFEANTYHVTATSDIYEAIRLATSHHPGCILLMLSPLAVICDAARQLRPHTSTKIIAFSHLPVATAERNVALQNGCDDYRDAFLRADKRG